MSITAEQREGYIRRARLGRWSTHDMETALLFLEEPSLFPPMIEARRVYLMDVLYCKLAFLEKEAISEFLLRFFGENFEFSSDLDSVGCALLRKLASHQELTEDECALILQNWRTWSESCKAAPLFRFVCCRYYACQLNYPAYEVVAAYISSTHEAERACTLLL